MPPRDSEDARWFDERILPHEAMLKAWLASRFGPRCPVDDIVHDAYVQILQARANGELHSPKAFLFATARNLAIDHHRRHDQSRTKPLVESDLSNVSDESFDVPEAVARSQEQTLLTEAIQSLPTQCRRIFTLRMVYGLKQREIGERLGLSDRTVAAQIAIAVDRCSTYILRRAGRRVEPK